MVLHTLTYIRRKLIGIGVPGCAPTLRHHFLTIDIHLDIARIVENKLALLFLTCTGLLSATGRLDEAFVNHVGTHQVHTFGEILDAAVIRLQGNLRFLRCHIFVINRILITYQFLTLGIHIGTCQVTLLAILIIELERTVQLQIVVGIAETAVRIRIPEQTVVLIRQHKGDRHFRVILEKVLVLPLHVKLFTLVLSETIERLILR